MVQRVHIGRDINGKLFALKKSVTAGIGCLLTLFWAFCTLIFWLGGAKMPYPLTLEIYFLLNLNLVQKFMQMKAFKNCLKGYVHCSNFADVKTFLR